MFDSYLGNGVVEFRTGTPANPTGDDANVTLIEVHVYTDGKVKGMGTGGATGGPPPPEKDNAALAYWGCSPFTNKPRTGSAVAANGSTSASLTGECRTGWWDQPGGTGKATFSRRYIPAPPGENNATYKLSLYNAGSEATSISAITVVFFNHAGKEIGSWQLNGPDTGQYIIEQTLAPGQTFSWLVSPQDSGMASGTATCQVTNWSP